MPPGSPTRLARKRTAIKKPKVKTGLRNNAKLPPLGPRMRLAEVRALKWQGLDTCYKPDLQDGRYGRRVNLAGSPPRFVKNRKVWMVPTLTTAGGRAAAQDFDSLDCGAGLSMLTAVDPLLSTVSRGNAVSRGYGCAIMWYWAVAANPHSVLTERAKALGRIEHAPCKSTLRTTLRACTFGRCVTQLQRCLGSERKTARQCTMDAIAKHDGPKFAFFCQFARSIIRETGDMGKAPVQIAIRQSSNSRVFVSFARGNRSLIASPSMQAFHFDDGDRYELAWSTYAASCFD